MASSIRFPHYVCRQLLQYRLLKMMSKSSGCCVNYSSQLTFDTLLEEKNKLRTQKALRDPEAYNLQVPNLPIRAYAAILVPLCTVKGEPSLLFTLRSRRLKKHKGQVSFPGGNVDPTDPDAVYTALRETQEELGMDPSRFEIWGQMRPLPSSTQKVVNPVVARIKGGDLDVEQLRPNEHEVEQAFTVPLSHLCNPANIGVTRFRPHEGNHYTTPVFLGAPHRIWGLTAIVTHVLLTFLAPGLYTFKVVHKKSVHHRPKHRAAHSHTKMSSDS